MNNFRKIKLSEYERADTYHAFLNHEVPVFSITAGVNITSLLKFCKKKELRFFSAISYFVSLTVNFIPQLRHRIVNGELLEFEKVDPGFTVLMDNDTFSFCDSTWNVNFHEFISKANADIDGARVEQDLEMREKHDMFFISNNPWISFTSFVHPYIKQYSSIPIITLGKYSSNNGENTIPIAVQANHALVDGLHIGRFFQALSAFLRKEEIEKIIHRE